MDHKNPMLIALFILLIVVTGCSSTATDRKEQIFRVTTTKLNTKGVAAIVNGEPIYEKDLNTAIANSKQTSKIWGIPPLKRDQLLKSNIWSTVMQQEVKRQRIMVSKTELADYTREKLIEFDEMSADIKDKSERAAKACGFKTYKDQILSNELQEHYRLVLALSKLDQRIRDKAAEVEVPPIPFDEYQDNLVKKAKVEMIIPTISK